MQCSPCQIMALGCGEGLPGGGGRDIPCLTNFKSTNSAARNSVRFLKNERTNYAWFPEIGHSMKWSTLHGCCFFQVDCA